MPNYSIDTRTIEEGEYFVAIEGERHDGHDFVDEAVEKGAGGLVLQRRPEGVSIPDEVDVAIVDDGETYLAEQAREKLLRLETDIVAITGSVGKTTTRSAVETVLKQDFPVVASEGNLNTVLGLALTVLNRLKHPEEKLVAEMGAYQRGSIATLCRYYRPQVAIVTTVQPVHLERMGSIENIRLAKQELVEAVPEVGAACLNWDDERVRSMAPACRGKVIPYGEHVDAAVRPDRIRVDVPLLGPHATHTALAAYSAALQLGMSDDAINEGISQLKAERGRLRKLPARGGGTLIDDSYNAALSSTLAALETIAKFEASRRIVFLGDMLELGEEEASSHREVTQRAAEVADLLILVGERMHRGAEETGVAEAAKVRLYDSANAAVKDIHQNKLFEPDAEDVFLVKGSASTRMERIAEALLSSNVKAEEVLVRQDPGWKEIE